MTDGQVLGEYFRGFRNGMFCGVMAAALGAFALGLVVGYAAPARPVAGPQPAASAPAKGTPMLVAASAPDPWLDRACLGYWFGDVSMERDRLRKRVCGK